MLKLNNKKDFISLDHVNRDTFMFLLKKALWLKKKFYQKKFKPYLKNKTLGILFYKQSTRTRVAFEVGMHQLGGTSIFLHPEDTQITRQESMLDTVKVLSRYLNALAIRTYSQTELEMLADIATIPIINALTDIEHPCQIIADFLTIIEKKKLDNLKIAFIGDAYNNVALSLMAACHILNVRLHLAMPEKYYQLKSNDYKSQANKNHFDKYLKPNLIELSHDPLEASANADVIYTDVWCSMGQENQKYISFFKDFQVNEKLIQKARNDFIFLHCLPAHRGQEVHASVIDGDHSLVFDQAENKLHAQKAILWHLMQ